MVFTPDHTQHLSLFRRIIRQIIFKKTLQEMSFAIFAFCFLFFILKCLCVCARACVRACESVAL